MGTGFVGDVAQQQKTTIVTRAQEDPRFQPDIDRGDQTLALNVMATAMVTEGVTVGAIQISNKLTGDGMFEPGRPRAARGRGCARRRVAPQRSAAWRREAGPTSWRCCSTSAARSPPRSISTACSSPSSTSRSRALPFDRGAVGLYEKGRCDIRRRLRARTRSIRRIPGSRISSGAPNGRRAGANHSI